MKNEGKKIIFFLLSLVGSCWLVTLNHYSRIADAAELTEILRRGYLIVGVKDNWRPLGFRDETGHLQGLEIDLAQRLALEILGRADAVKLQPVMNRDRLAVVLDGQVDLVIAGVSITESRSRLVSFSTPYYIDSTTFIAQKPTIQTLKDLAGQKIAVLNGSSTIAIVKYFLPTAKLIGVDSYQEGRSRLNDHSVAAFAGDMSVLTGWVQESPATHLLISVQLSAQALCIVMPKGIPSDHLRRKVNRAIAQWENQGWLPERRKYWGLP